MTSEIKNQGENEIVMKQIFPYLSNGNLSSNTAKPVLTEGKDGIPKKYESLKKSTSTPPQDDDENRDTVNEIKITQE